MKKCKIKVNDWVCRETISALLEYEGYKVRIKAHQDKKGDPIDYYIVIKDAGGK